MKVTNNAVNALVIGTVTIPAGETVEVEAWDEVKDSAPIKAFLKAEAISTGKAAAKAKPTDADDRKAVIAELDKLKATYKQDATTAELLVALEDAKKKAAQA